MNANGMVSVEKGAELDARLAGLQSRTDFVLFLHALLDDLRNNPGIWENRDLSSFLEALAAWTVDLEGFCKNRGEPVPDTPSWKLLGQMFLAARAYE